MGIFSTLIGGFLNRKAAKETRKNSIEDARLNLSRVRESAELAGFNPLTALQSTGGNLGPISANVPPLASAAALEGAVQSVGDILSGRSAVRNQQEDANLRLTQLRIEREEAGDAGKLARRIAGAATQFVPRPPAIPSRSTQRAPKPTPVAGLTDYEETTDDTRRSQRDIATGVGAWKVDESYDPAEFIEQEYAEIAANIYGTGKAIIDAGRNTRAVIDHYTDGKFGEWTDAHMKKYGPARWGLPPLRRSALVIPKPPPGVSVTFGPPK